MVPGQFGVQRWVRTASARPSACRQLFPGEHCSPAIDPTNCDTQTPHKGRSACQPRQHGRQEEFIMPNSWHSSWSGFDTCTTRTSLSSCDTSTQQYTPVMTAPCKMGKPPHFPPRHGQGARLLQALQTRGKLLGNVSSRVGMCWASPPVHISAHTSARGRVCPNPPPSTGRHAVRAGAARKSWCVRIQADHLAATSSQAGRRHLEPFYLRCCEKSQPLAGGG